MTRLIRSTELIARSTDAVRTYYHYASDEMGSTTHIVDEQGNVQNRYKYDAWGNLTAQEEAVPNRFKYTGQQFDPITQQYYLRARFYNPVIARFTQEDTYRGDGLNLYAYCANNPVYYVDPTGYYRNCVKEAYDRIRKENPGMSAQDAYDRARQEVGFGSEVKERTPSKYPAAAGQNPPKPPMSWNEFQHVNHGKWTRDQMSAEYEKYKAMQVGPNTSQHYLHRPVIRKNIIDALNAQNPNKVVVVIDGVPYVCPNPHIGHTPGNEFWRLRNLAEQQGMTQAEFNDYMNSHPEFYRYEDPMRNMSHMDEDKTPLDSERYLGKR